MAVFVFNDQTKKNSHGFYLLNAGGRLDRFRENPVMLHAHNLEQLIGKWNNLRIEGDLLLADPEFDEGDDLAVKMQGKVSRGYLRGASPGIIIHAAEWRSNEAASDVELFVTDWEIFEGSVVSVPSNAGALNLRVYDANRSLVNDDQVMGHIENIIRLGIDQHNNFKPKNKKMEIKLSPEALVVLGITDGADGEAISAAIINMKKNQDQLSVENTTLKETIEAGRKAQVAALVDLAIKEGRIAADKKESFVKLGMADYETAKSTIEAIPARQNLSQRMQSGKQNLNADRDGWTYMEWAKKDPEGLKRLKIEHPDDFSALKQRIK